ncbi:SCO2322 family protein [Streptomyces sp. S.PB5]|uniref:SCO2322 family protein n=1 Tax=Streptomyces sp. S.PB5 TaxID=3020844 RepID=UPI0025B12FD2|nr:SCO2322 family protein [Streptomyces sp. S.PB5]MDN3020555.1 SCO2322 family protein [Streptomyces sp. S.PB5]
MKHRRAAALLLAAFLLTALAPWSAQAAGYRYWSFWDRTGSAWIYATQGPATVVPSDGDLQGFRFAVSEDTSDATKPRGTASFETICAKTPAADGRKRVALVIDFGTSSDAPSGETPPAPRTACALVAEDATTAEALAAVAKPLRYDTNALLCAIAGYPETGCGEQVASGEKTTGETSTGERSTGAARTEPDPDGGPSVGLLAGTAAVAALGAAAMWQARRRRNAR